MLLHREIDQHAGATVGAPFGTDLEMPHGGIAHARLAPHRLDGLRHLVGLGPLAAAMDDDIDILISEVGPRDGLQSIEPVMPLAAKKAWIAAEAAVAQAQ